MPLRHKNTSSFPQDTPMDNQLPTSPMDTEFRTVPPTPMDAAFMQQASPTPMDTEFPGGSTTTLSSVAMNGTSATATFAPQSIGTTTQTTTSTPYAPSPPHQQQQQQLGTPPAPFSAHRASRTPRDDAFREKLRQMALPLAPLVQLTTGDVHPSFPSTLLGFWLLTEPELESLAHFYHQRTPCRWTHHYPCPVAWDSRVGLEEKRRKMGKFMGLRGCDTPVRIRTEEDLLDEARRARVAADEEAWRRKLPWY